MLPKRARNGSNLFYVDLWTIKQGVHRLWSTHTFKTHYSPFCIPHWSSCSSTADMNPQFQCQSRFRCWIAESEIIFLVFRGLTGHAQSPLAPSVSLNVINFINNDTKYFNNPFIQWVRRALSLGVKRPEPKADHSPPFSAEVSYTATPSIRLYGVVLS